MGLDQGDIRSDVSSKAARSGIGLWSVLSVVLGVVWFGGIGSCLGIAAGLKGLRVAGAEQSAWNRRVAFLGITPGIGIGIGITVAFFVSSRPPQLG